MVNYASFQADNKTFIFIEPCWKLIFRIVLSGRSPHSNPFVVGRLSWIWLCFSSIMTDKLMHKCIKEKWAFLLLLQTSLASVGFPREFGDPPRAILISDPHLTGPCSTFSCRKPIRWEVSCNKNGGAISRRSREATVRTVSWKLAIKDAGESVWSGQRCDMNRLVKIDVPSCKSRSWTWKNESDYRKGNVAVS